MTASPIATGNLALPVIILQQHYGAIARDTAVTEPSANRQVLLLFTYFIRHALVTGVIIILLNNSLLIQSGTTS
ncbi:hypothetical protein BSQ35_13755 [Serratia liquefaciens]|nr:hypothetical protein BSQ35_13755 [Serratia liquefaciens]